MGPGLTLYHYLKLCKGDFAGTEAELLYYFDP